MRSFTRWRKAKVRALECGRAHLTITPHFGFAMPWPGGRIRWARHHGLQVVKWNGVGRWIVSKQLLGRSRVKGELYAKEK